jgi:hypothetical protein
LILFLVFVGAVTPAFKGDLDWAQARRTDQAQLISEQLVKWPQDEVRFSSGVFAFLRSNLPKEALPLTEAGLELFPRSSVLWNYLYQNPVTPTVRKNQAREKLIELDPLNPAVLELKRF